MRRRGTGDEDGAAAVEFALVMIPFMIVVLGMVQYGWYFYVSQTTGGAASTVARRLQVGDCWTGDEAKNLAKKQAIALTTLTKSPASISPTTPIGTTVVTVTLQSNAAIIGFLPMPNNGVVERSVTTRLEDTEANTPCT